jgi:hypothetical protein
MAARAAQYFTEAEERLRQLEIVTATIQDDIPDPIEWAEGVSGNVLDDWQRNFMLSDATDVLFDCSRQSGKSQIVSLKAAYRAKFKMRNVAVLAPTLRQSSIIYRRAKLWLQRDDTQFARITAHELELQNGATFSALPGDRPDISIRGDTVDDLIVDEASRIKDSLIVAATPATATIQDATITYLSTPCGKVGAFWNAWNNEDWWEKITVTAYQCPRISHAFLEREKKRLGPLFRQEYLCEFMDAPGGLFLSEDLDELFSKQHEYEFDDGVALPVREPIWQ